MSKINAWWARTPEPGNFGDMITPYFIKKVTGSAPTWNRAKHGTFMGAGSTIRLAGPRCVVWGSGIMRRNDDIRKDLVIHAVRGPVTAQRGEELGIDVPPVYGDPGLLLPRIFKPETKVTHLVGVLPHYVHLREAVRIFHDTPEVKIISPLSPTPERVIEDILSCEMVFSSSLHGLIESEAYGVPYSWITFPRGERQLSGDGAKFEDFYRSIGEEALYDIGAFEIKTKEDLRHAHYHTPGTTQEMWDALWKSCPFTTG